MSIERKFYPAGEVAALLGCDGLFVMELVEFHGLRFLTRFEGTKAAHMDDEGFDDSLKESGGTELGKWDYLAFAAEQELKKDPEAFPEAYLLNGWHEMPMMDCLALLRGGSAAGWPASQKDGKPLGSFFTFGHRKYVTIDKAVVRASDIERYRNEITPSDPKEAERQLSTREKNNLLKIIAALAKQAGLDGNKGAQAIEAAVAKAGFDGPKEKTIRDVLAQVRELKQ